jgi:hypothetical protein
VFGFRLCRLDQPTSGISACCFSIDWRMDLRRDRPLSGRRVERVIL